LYADVEGGMRHSIAELELQVGPGVSGRIRTEVW